ncbi:MAG TPA: hypothetical protein VGN17_02360 [Bryobacteraceae bacterium]|jgi:hypothetical protein
MSAEEFTKRLPLVTNLDLPFKPPILFNGLSARVFPLRANLDALQQLCDNYLNIVPEEVGYFRAMAPYVNLMVLDYGEISLPVTSAGWFAQVEVFFSVQVEWYKRVNGQWVFHDWAVITPYIFVDDKFSVPLGRVVYGFPKILASVTCAPSAWTSDPLAAVTLAKIETPVFPEVYAGTPLETKTFLEVQRDAPMSNLRVPPDPRSPIMPWVVASNVANAVGGFGRDALWMAQSMRVSPINPLSSPSFLPEMITRMAPAFAPGGVGMTQNSLNLKQFRHSEDPTRICYQSLTNGQMQMTGFNGGGLMGEERIWLGDASGGHTIRLHQYSSLPVSRVLGLEEHRRWRSDGVDVAEFKPVLPFWVDVDVKYFEGANLAWRTLDGIWKDGGGRKLIPAQKPADAADAPQFNSTVSSAIEAIAGPFQYAGTTIRVLPLLAKKDKLQAFLDSYMNSALGNEVLQNRAAKAEAIESKASKTRILTADGGEEQVRFSVWARPPIPVNSGFPVGGDLAYVYLTASSFGSVVSKSDNVGDWAKYELAFNIPVKFERKGKDGEWNVEGVGLVPAFTMVDDCVAAISRLEVQGIAATTANFVIPESVWLKDGESVDGTQSLLRVDAEIVSAAGQKSAMQTVIEISEREANAGLGDTQSFDVPYQWAETLRLELGTKKATKAAHPMDCKVARQLALELLGNKIPISLYTLKQFPDVADPNKACYQSIVRVPRVLDELFDLREIEETLVVRIFDFPSLDIVETLGIVASRPQDTGNGIVYSAQAIRPFYINATVDEPLADRLLDRVGSLTWTINSNAFKTLLSDTPEAPAIAADALAEKLQDQMDPCRMAAIMYQARTRLERNGPEQSAHDKAQARQALASVDPQVVIDSILSREWGNNDPNTRWRLGRQEMIDAYGALPVAGPAKALAETALYKAANNRMTLRPGSVAAVPGMPEIVDDIIGRQQQFTELRLQMEDRFDIIGPWAILGLRGLEEKLGKQVPTAGQLFTAGAEFVKTMMSINLLSIAGEPSERNNLDTQVVADKFRLGELLTLIGALKPAPGESMEVSLERIWEHLEEFRQALSLTRAYCEAQYQALLNKLSRTYQKPDFCVYRDSVGVQADRLLPETLSWDKDWYFGNISSFQSLSAAAPPQEAPVADADGRDPG